VKRPVKLDRINRKILTILQQNARISNIELADRVGLSPSACLQRTKALEEAGYILQYVMAVDLDKICNNVMVYVEFTLEKHRLQDLERFERAMRAIPEIVDCLRVSGRFDYISFVVCNSIADFNKLCDDLLSRDLAISSIRSNVVLDKPKWFGGYPLEHREWKDGGDGARNR
jgi:Lrp/AsnC family leucine-responsive transcriptional regulator